MPTKGSLTAAGIALVAAGLIALPPAIAVAHTDDAYTLGYLNPTPTVSASTMPPVVFASQDKNSAVLTWLPTETPGEDLQYPMGIEINDETGYVTHIVFNEDPSAFESPVMGALSNWDHSTGEVSNLVPLVLPADISDAGALFEGYDETFVFFTKLLDTASDGSLLALALIYGVNTETSAEAAGIYIVSIDPESGLTTPVASIEEGLAEYALSSATGLATDPTTGITWLFIYSGGAGAHLTWGAAIDFDAPLDPPSVVSAVSDVLPTSLDDVAALATPSTDGGLSAAALAESDLEEFTGITTTLGESLLIGADFDSEGTLWFEYIDLSVESDSYELGLASAPAPFALDTPVVDSGLADYGDAVAVIEGGLGLTGVFTVENTDDTLAATGVSGGSVLLPVGAGVIALLGGVLLMLGRRRRETTA